MAMANRLIMRYGLQIRNELGLFVKSCSA